MKSIFKFVCLVVVLVGSFGSSRADDLKYLANISPNDLRSQILDKSLTPDELRMLAFNYAFIFEFEKVYREVDNSPKNNAGGCYGRETECQYWLKARGLVEASFNELDGAFGQLAQSLNVQKSVLLAAFGINLKREKGSVDIDFQPNTTAMNARNSSWAYFYNYPNPNSAYPLNDYYSKTTPVQLFGQWYPELASALRKQIPKIDAAASKYNQQQVQLAANKAAEQAAFEKQQADYQKWLQTPAGQAYTADQARKQQEAEAKFAQEYPYVATLSCKSYGVQLMLLSCLTTSGGNFSGVLELTNGNDYGMYQWTEFNKISKSNPTTGSIQIDLRPRFKLKIQNAYFNGILELKIVDRATGKTVYEKDATQWQYINVSN